jgi:hypothetical protein
MILSIQSFLKKLGQTIESIVRILLLSRLVAKFDVKKKTSDAVIIMGNGPSLLQDITEYKEFLAGKDLVCVNHFPKTELYQQLQPATFVTAAPDLWLDHIDEKFVKQSRQLFEQIFLKTSWPLAFFIPFEAKKHKRWQKQLKGNKNITINYYNNTPIEGWDSFKNTCFNFRLGMPRPHNVMIPSIMISIALQYKKIFLLGADHSWLSEISVTEKNEVLINQKHFYDMDSSVGQPLDKRGIGKRTLPELLHKFTTAFSSYFEIERYTSFKNVRVFNATRKSFIDAFERVKPEDLKDE